MKFLVIPPIPNVSDLARVADGLFLVPLHESVRDEIRRIQKIKMLDNGAYEGEPVDDETLIKLSYELDVDIVIVPDVLRAKKKTLKRIHKFLEISPTTFEYMLVPQGRSPIEFFECLKEILKFEPDYIGFPIWLEKRFKCRVEIIHYSLQKLPQLRDIKIHLLGLDNPYEVRAYANCPPVVSVDSSLPCTLAHHGVTELLPVISKHNRVNLSQNLENVWLAEQLVFQLCRLCHGE